MTVMEYDFEEMTTEEREELVGKTLWRHFGVGFQRFYVYEIGRKKFKGKGVIADNNQGMIQKTLSAEQYLYSHHPKTLDPA